MGRDGLALPLTREQLDIWLSQESGSAGTDWQLGVLVKIDGAIYRDVLEQALRQTVAEAESSRVSFAEIDGQVVQKPIEDPDIELEFYDLTGPPDPVAEVRRRASAIQRTPMAMNGQLLKFACSRRGSTSSICSAAATTSFWTVWAWR